MNLSLLDPFALAQDYPNTLSTTLKWGHSSALRFNHQGTYLASGTIDGTIVIFDFDTNGVITILKGHTRTIQSLCWSQDGRYLLSSSRDWKSILWDLKSCKPVRTVRFDGPVWGADLNPNNPLQFIVSLYEDTPKMVDVTEDVPRLMTLPTQPLRPTTTAAPAKADKQLTLVVLFNKSGDYIITGTSRGWLNVISVETLEIIHSGRITTSNIKNMKLSATGRKVVINSSDRIIRQVRIPDFHNSNPSEWEFEVQVKFQDVVNRLQWNSVSFSTSGDYVLASTFEGHDVYMWETEMGSLIKIFEGPKEEMVEIAWHPTKVLLAVTGLDTGSIYIWTSKLPQKWSALAPDFAEVEENIEYMEQEDEFDIIDEDVMVQRLLDEENDEIVDIITIEQTKPSEAFIIPVDLDLRDECPESDEDI
ncbi:WD40 repeat-like protein [Nadsonia fulvescens var. elongata DSM 6958]|uniref:WD40 repeat-like protein n=1 Tax=Nadsonia fulvescens var. elongata DSM 6958 TaxID=857566 RepID=A0A1E3PI12_9ASCO|nr:WD40 repeat-like protein [Nadsonia fulvescens var. elongata DSM 6958]